MPVIEVIVVPTHVCVHLRVQVQAVRSVLVYQAPHDTRVECLIGTWDVPVLQHPQLVKLPVGSRQLHVG